MGLATDFWNVWKFYSKTKNHELEKGTRQGDPISAYLFILVSEIVFLSIKKNKKIKRLNIFSYTFLYTAYADDTTFFKKDKESLIGFMKFFDIFSSFSGLKRNKSKCEVSGIGALKGAKMALCGMKYIDLRLNAVKILGIHFTYNKKIENDENFLKQIISIKNFSSYGVREAWHWKENCFQSITNIQDSSSSIN